MTLSDVPSGSRKPVRLSITVPHSTYCRLVQQASHQGRSLSNLAAHLLDVGLSDG